MKRPLTYGSGYNRRMADRFAAMEAKNAELERRLANIVRMEVVTDVDPQKQRYRGKIGKDADGTDQKGPWKPYAQHAGMLKGHTPPVVGQTMMSFNPSGDHEQGIGFPATWSDANASPGQTADHVWTYGDKIKVEMADGKLTITCPDTTLKVDDDHKLQLDGQALKTVGKVKNRPTKDDVDKSIDGTHKHKDVEPGGSLSGPPV